MPPLRGLSLLFAMPPSYCYSIAALPSPGQASLHDAQNAVKKHPPQFSPSSCGRTPFNHMHDHAGSAQPTLGIAIPACWVCCWRSFCVSFGCLSVVFLVWLLFVV